MGAFQGGLVKRGSDARNDIEDRYRDEVSARATLLLSGD